MSTAKTHEKNDPFGSAARACRATLLTALVVCFSQPCAAQPDTVIDKVIEVDAPIATAEIIEPELQTLRGSELVSPAPIRRLPASNLPLWIEALDGPEYELKRDVAISIGRAHQEGYGDCSAAGDALINALNDRAAPRSVTVEIARTLIILNNQRCSKILKELLQAGSGTQFEMLVEPALARWHDKQMLAVWQVRLADRDVPRYRQLLAIQAFAELPASMTSDPPLHDELQNLIATSRDTGIMLEAARTLGKIKRIELEPLAQKYLSATDARSQLKQLAGVYLLLHHSSDASRDLLRQAITKGLSVPHQAPLVREAWRCLLEQNVSELSTLAPAAIRHSDPEVRRVALDTLLRFPSNEGIGLLGQTLDDPHPELRRAARQGMLRLGMEDSFQAAVNQVAFDAVERPSWREQEQAIVLLTLRDQTGAADRMLELLDSPRAEVAIAAAWGLRRLDVAEKRPALLEHAERLDQQVSDGASLHQHEGSVLAHLFEALGRARYQPAGPLLKRWIAKAPPRFFMNESRTAAIWSLGWLFEGSKDAALAKLLQARFLDLLSLEPEDLSVRQASAVSLGRIGNTDVVASLMPFARAGDLAAVWAVHQLTGETFPPPEVPIESGAHWMLFPIGSRQKATSVDATVR
ncbi:MAG: HEAT repeat domain-containing protein [Rhodopirellula sp.]|nr:HEAT repeat domain-containing protein [Rhodopirellula sp.]